MTIRKTNRRNRIVTKDLKTAVWNRPKPRPAKRTQYTGKLADTRTYSDRMLFSLHVLGHYVEVFDDNTCVITKTGTDTAPPYYDGRAEWMIDCANRGIVDYEVTSVKGRNLPPAFGKTTRRLIGERLEVTEKSEVIFANKFGEHLFELLIGQRLKKHKSKGR